ncbi:MAG TPA: hypothetical protein VGM90_16150 [Kofleriaceae bacterium]|jgi:hypothetical protein
MPDIFLGGAARLLLVLHALAAIALIGSTTHHAIISWGYLRGRFNVRLGRIYAATIAATYAITFGFGLLVYPTFRYHVRALYLDRYEKWASNLFDMKENFAALGFGPVIALLILSRVMNPKEDTHLRAGYIAFAFLLCAIVWFDLISGLVITNVRGV